MLAHLNEAGTLILEPTRETEIYAMKKWFEDWHKGLVSLEIKGVDVAPISKGNLESILSNG
ncbi:MAG TPA: hypothetical protein VHO48_13870 [Anaerolineaceae bacterium]|nr:hypothetical protein [Anaerolineaceae bacterium]